MKKLIYRPYLSLVFILSALFFPVEAWAELYFMYAAGGPQVTEKSVNWSERGSQILSWPIAVYNGQMVTVTYSSGDANKATVDANGDVTIVSPGVVSINASYTSVDDGQTYNASYTLTIVDDRDDMETAGASFSSSTASAAYGDAPVNTPTISTGKLGNATFTYSSSDESVATVNNSGNVTIKGAGTAEIKASFAGNETFKPGYLTYTLTVAQKEVSLTWGTTEFTYNGGAQAPTATATGLVGSDACNVTVEGAQTDAGSNYTATATGLSNTNYKLPADNTTINFSIAKATSSVTKAPTANTLTYTGSAQALVTAGEASGGTMQYSLDNQTFAETIPTGTEAGSYTVYYKVVGDKNHEDAAGGQVSVTITKADTPDPDPQDPQNPESPKDSELSFASATATATYGDETVSSPALSNPHQLSLTWDSSNKDVATVDGSGVVTIVGGGEAVISAAFAGNDNYLAKTVSYTLTVNKFQPKITFASVSATVKLGEDFTPPKITTDPKDLELVYTSSDENVAKVDAGSGEVTVIGEGTARITATFNATHNYHYASAFYDLTVEDDSYLLDPIEEDRDYKMEAKDFINDDGTEVDLSNVIINDILFTLKNQDSSEGDGFDPDLDCIVLNTVVAASVVNSMVEKGVLPGTDEYAEEFTGLTFLMPAGEGEIIVTSQELNGVYLMVKVGKNKPVAISMPEMGDYSIPYKSNTKTYVYLWNGGTDANSTRGKKSMTDARVRNVSYKKLANGIQPIVLDTVGDQPWYDLSGRPISKPMKKGIYIHGNRKVVIK